MFQYQSINKTAGLILFNDQLIAEMRDLCLCNVRFKSDGKIVIGADVPVPLYWRQYANHEHPDRNCGSNGSIELIETTQEKLVFDCRGTSKSKEVFSIYRIEISYSNTLSSFVYDIHAELHVQNGKHWDVTFNPDHGELEFCNLYPLNTFVTDPTIKKSYDACYVVQKNIITKISHHHLESSDKHNILLHRGDSFYWLLEDENIGVEILTDETVHAGLCAYMWDAHFAYRVCDKADIHLLEGFDRRSHFRLFSLDRNSGEQIVRSKKQTDISELENIPIYVDDVNTFSKTILNMADNQQNVWPWATEIVQGLPTSVEFIYDRECGYDDNFSVSIQSKNYVTARWIATTLGPAFGGQNYFASKKYKLSAMIKTSDLEGGTTIGIRLHREGMGSVFDFATYDLYFSICKISGTSEWVNIDIITPPIAPAPDRIHLILQHSGIGRSWFDNVFFEILS